VKALPPVNGGFLIQDKHAFELLSRAYVMAVACKAQAHLADIKDHEITLGGDEFDYGIDGRFRNWGSTNGIKFPKGRGFDFQLKATTRWTINKGHIVYEMEASAYNKLILQNQEKDSDKGVLLLLCIPDNLKNAVHINQDHCLLQRSVYWHVIKGARSANSSSVTVKIPLKNLFDEVALDRILKKADRRQL
jgi:hypothetical protein